MLSPPLFALHLSHVLPLCLCCLGIRCFVASSPSIFRDPCRTFCLSGVVHFSSPKSCCRLSAALIFYENVAPVQAPAPFLLRARSQGCFGFQTPTYAFSRPLSHFLRLRGVDFLFKKYLKSYFHHRRNLAAASAPRQCLFTLYENDAPVQARAQFSGGRV